MIGSIEIVLIASLILKTNKAEGLVVLYYNDGLVIYMDW
jgi:hypothetical protein